MTIDQCNQGATALCALIHRDANGVLVTIDTPFPQYLRPCHARRGLRGRLAGDSGDYRATAGELHRRALHHESRRAAGAARGADGRRWWRTALFPARCRWAITLGALRFNVLERYIGEGAIDRSVLPTVLAPAQNRVNDVYYTDLTATYGRDAWEAFVTVNNALDKDPPLAPAAYFTFRHGYRRWHQYVALRCHRSYLYGRSAIPALNVSRKLPVVSALTVLLGFSGLATAAAPTGAAPAAAQACDRTCLAALITQYVRCPRSARSCATAGRERRARDRELTRGTPGRRPLAERQWPPGFPSGLPGCAAAGRGLAPRVAGGRKPHPLLGALARKRAEDRGH